jgi:hypothetical protein
MDNSKIPHGSYNIKFNINLELAFTAVLTISLALQKICFGQRSVVDVTHWMNRVSTRCTWQDLWIQQWLMEAYRRYLIARCRLPATENLPFALYSTTLQCQTLDTVDLKMTCDFMLFSRFVPTFRIDLLPPCSRKKNCSITIHTLFWYYNPFVFFQMQISIIQNDTTRLNTVFVVFIYGMFRP